MIPRETQEGAFYRAALALHQNHFQQAQAVSDVLVSYAVWSRNAPPFVGRTVA